MIEKTYLADGRLVRRTDAGRWEQLARLHWVEVAPRRAQDLEARRLRGALVVADYIGQRSPNTTILRPQFATLVLQ